MGGYRLVQKGFWQEAFVMDGLTPEERYFYLYLKTGTKTTQCGIYQLPMRLAEAELEYNRETIEKLLGRFVEYGKVVYDEKTREVYMCDWLQDNPIVSTNVEKCVLRELKEVQNEAFCQLYLQACLDAGVEVPLLLEHFGMPKAMRAAGAEEAELYVIHTEEAEEPAVESNAGTVFQFYQEHFGSLSSYAAEELNAWVGDLSDVLVLKALQIAYEQNKRSIAYVKGILRDWHAKGYTTLAEVDEAIQRYRSKQQVKGQMEEWQDEVDGEVPSDKELEQLLKQGWQP